MSSFCLILVFHYFHKVAPVKMFDTVLSTIQTWDEIITQPIRDILQ